MNLRYDRGVGGVAKSALALACAVCVGCGLVDYEPLGGGAGDGGGGDSDLALSGQIVNIRHLVALTTSSTDRDPSLTADKLELFFQSNRSEGPFMVSVRASVDDEFPEPVAIDVLNLPGSTENRSPEISGDGLRITFTALASGDTVRRLYTSSRPNRDAQDWAVPTLAPGLESVQVNGATVTDDETLLIFTNRELDAPGGGGR